MKKYVLLVMVFFSSFSVADTPEILVQALDSYVEKGRDHFLPALLKGSAMENEKSILTQVNMMTQLEAYYGAPESWEVLAVCELNKRVRTTYYILFHENGPVFGYLNSYKKKKGQEVTTKFQFHTEPDQILPYYPIEVGDICGGD